MHIGIHGNAPSVGAHPLCGNFSWQGLAKYHPLYRMQSLMHRCTLVPILHKYEAWYLFTVSQLRLCTMWLL